MRSKGSQSSRKSEITLLLQRLQMNCQEMWTSAGFLTLLSKFEPLTLLKWEKYNSFKYSEWSLKENHET